MRTLAKTLVEKNWFTRSIITLILINAVLLGLETYPDIMAVYGPQIILLDHIILAIFVAEIALRMLAYGRAFWRDPWSLFDVLVVTIALLPANEAFAVLRALRVLRVLRLISASPNMRRVVQGLFSAIPGIGSIATIMLILFYVFAVVATKLFGAGYGEWFGTLQASLFTLFQIMTLEGWAEIVRTIGQTHPWAWVFFILYILVSTFTVLNLFIAVIVDAMQRQHKAEEAAELAANAAPDENMLLLKAMQADLAAVKEQLHKLTSPDKVPPTR